MKEETLLVTLEAPKDYRPRFLALAAYLEENPVEQSEWQNQAKNRYDELQSLRAEATNFLATSTVLGCLIEKHKPATYVSLSGYPSLQECHCRGFSRGLSEFSRDMRDVLVQTILREIKSRDLTQQRQINITAIGSGCLLQEVNLLALLFSQGIYNIHLNLVDKVYADAHLDKDGRQFWVISDVMEDFIKLGWFTLGVGIRSGEHWQEQDISLTRRSFENTLNIFESRYYHPEERQMTVTFYSGVTEYSQSVGKHSVDASTINVLYDIDLCISKKEWNEVTAPLGFTAVPGTLWYSVGKRRHAGNEGVRVEVNLLENTFF